MFLKRSVGRLGLSLIELLVAAHIFVFVLTMATAYTFSLVRSMDTGRQRAVRRFYSEYVLSFLRNKVLSADRIFIGTSSFSGGSWMRSENLFLRVLESSSNLLPEVRWVCFSFVEGDDVSGELRYYRSSSRSLHDDNNNVGTLLWNLEWTDDSIWSVTMEDDPTSSLLTSFPYMFYVRIDFVRHSIKEESIIFMDRRFPNKHLTKILSLSDVPGDVSFVLSDL